MAFLTATISKTGASVSSLRYKGHEMVTGNIYYSMDGGQNYRTPVNCQFTVKIKTPDMVDIGMKRAWSNEPPAFDIEVHYVLARGAS